MADGDKATFIVQLIEKIRGPATRAGNAVARLSKRIDKVRSQALGNVMGTVKDVMLLGTAAAVGMGAAVIGVATNFADFAQRSMLGLNQLAKHGASAGKLFDHVRREAEDLGLDVKDTTKTFLKFLALQFDPKSATEMIRMGADLRAFGTDAEGVQRIFAQIGQIKAKGKLQGEELIVLAENGISTQLVYEELQKTLGKTKDEVLKLQQAGKLDDVTALDAIGKAVNKKLNQKTFGETGKKIADSTLSGMSGRLKAQVQNALTDIGQMVEGPLTEAFAPIAQGIGAFLKSDDGTAFIRAIADSITVAADAVKVALPFVKEFMKSFGSSFMAAAPEIFNAVGDALGFMSGSSGDVMTNTKLIAETLGQVAAFGIGAAAVLGGLLHAAFTSVSVVIQYLVGAWQGLIKTVGEFVFVLSDWWANVQARFSAAAGNKVLYEFGRAIVTGLATGMNALVNLPFQAIDNIGEGIKGRLKNVLGIKSPSREMMAIGAQTVAGLEIGLKPMGDVLRDALPANDNLGSFQPRSHNGPS